jgi:hypothetical protein
MGDKAAPTRGELMREIGRLYAKLALIERGESTEDEPPVTRSELKRQIAALTIRLMAL